MSPPREQGLSFATYHLFTDSILLLGNIKSFPPGGGLSSGVGISTDRIISGNKFSGRNFHELIYRIPFIFLSFSLNAQICIWKERYGGIVREKFQRGSNCRGRFVHSKMWVTPARVLKGDISLLF